MHDGGPVITTKYMWMAFIGAFLKALMMVGWVYLLYLNTTTLQNDPQLLRTIRGAVCGFFVGWNLYDTIKYSRAFIKARKEYKDLVAENSDFMS